MDTEQNKPISKEEIALHAPEPADLAVIQESKKKFIVATYSADETGKLVFQAVPSRPKDLSYFDKKNVLILFDGEESGQKHAVVTAKELDWGAKSIKLVSLPDLPERGDVSEWLKDEQTRKRLIELVNNAPQWSGLWESLPSGADLQAMDIKVEYVVEGLIPEKSITTIAGRAGSGKTMLLMGLGDAVTKGENFLGLKTKRMPVVLVDFENPLGVDIERARMLNITDMKFWHNGMDQQPPRIDKPAYTQYLDLPPSLLIIDSLRASQGGDENSSKDMTLMMSRCKELRDYGHTVVLITHTLKGNEKQFRGSMSIEDQADHPLFFYPVRNKKKGKKGKKVEVADEDEADFDRLPFYLGTKEKTRFEPFSMYVKRAGSGRFTVVEDPKFSKMRAIMELLPGRSGMTQTEVVDLVYKQLGIAKKTTRKLLNDKDAVGTYWKITRGANNSKLFTFRKLSGWDDEDGL